jgi:hypothetical protein
MKTIPSLSPHDERVTTMKHLYTFSHNSFHNNIFRTTILGVLLLIVLSFVFESALAQTKDNATYRERAMNAAQQMRDYYRRVATEAEQAKVSKLSAVPTKAGIKIDKTFKTSSSIFYHDDMESGVGGWTTAAYGSSNDLWHQTTTNYVSTTTSWWGAIESQGNYNTGSRVNNALISPAIDLIGAAAPIKLLFSENFMTEIGWDYCMVDVSTDGGTTWTHLRGGYGSAPNGDSRGWIITTLDLSPYAGQNIKVRFYFDTGDAWFNDFPGWYVDDVMIFDQGGMITGKKFFDMNQNGVKDIGERGIKDWYITATGHGSSQGIILSTKTNYRGKYWLPLPLGSYTITETYQPNWVQTSPVPLPGKWEIDLATPDTLVDSIHFGNYTTASFINGMKFDDINKNGLYDAGDTVMPGWKIILADTLGNEIDFDWTDSLGQYQLYVFKTGTYIVREVPKRGWVQSYPAQEYYRIEVADLSTNITGKDFGNYYSPLTYGIMGQKFADRNRNKIHDQGEDGLAGFKIFLMRKGNGNKYSQYKERTTDSSGYYQFLSVPLDTYKVIEKPLVGWWQSYPDSCYYIEFIPGGKYDTLDFGNYQLERSSIGGMKFNDLDTSGTKDNGEAGLDGWTITLSGVTVYGTSAIESRATDQDGAYEFADLWPGRYVISEVMRSGWRQTYPANLGSHIVTVGLEEHIGGIDFGNVTDNNFSLAFRTFLPESLALAVDKYKKHNPIDAKKPDKTEFWITVYNDTSVAAESLIVNVTKSLNLSNLILSQQGKVNFIGTNSKKLKIVFDLPVQPGDSLVMHGYTPNLGIHASYQKWFLTVGGRAFIGHREIYINSPRLPMPNAINLLSAGAGINLKVGLGGPHSVVHNTYRNVMTSLVEVKNRMDRMHIGVPRCLDKYSAAVAYRPISRQQTSLPPTRHNNILFAEAIALQANINGSDYGILPGGFGNLIFDEGGNNALNGLTVRAIAAYLDNAMSGFDNIGKKCYDISFDSLYTTIRKIDSAFSGPIDTFSFAGGLRYKPARPLADVSYLQLDSSFASMGTYTIRPIPTAVPEQFTLYQNYPNPFNPSTVIEFTLPEMSFVTLKIYNTIGQEVAVLFNREKMDDGGQMIEFNASNLPSGVYFYRLVAEGIADEETGAIGQTYLNVKKMLLLK